MKCVAFITPTVTVIAHSSQQQAVCLPDCPLCSLAQRTQPTDPPSSHFLFNGSSMSWEQMLQLW